MKRLLLVAMLMGSISEAAFIKNVNCVGSKDADGQPLSVQVTGSIVIGSAPGSNLLNTAGTLKVVVEKNKKSVLNSTEEVSGTLIKQLSEFSDVLNLYPSKESKEKSISFSSAVQNGKTTGQLEVTIFAKPGSGKDDLRIQSGELSCK
jgi:hypothetical protein